MKKYIMFLFLSSVISAQSWDQVIKAVASDRGAGDNFGNSVSISGDYAVVGAYFEDEDASGGNTLFDPGSAYIFHKNSGTWDQGQKVIASDRGSYDNFGYSVSISGDYAIVGAYREDEDALGVNALSGAGSAYIFHNNSGTWEEVQKIVASDRGEGANFGYSVSISGDYAIVGAYYETKDASGGGLSLIDAGSAYIFYNNAGTWEQVQKIVASDREENNLFGNSVSISGDYAIVGAYFESEDASGTNTLNLAGSAYLFYNNAGTWNQVQKIVASDRDVSDNFGNSVSISGDYAIVAANGEDEDASGGNFLSNAGSAYIFHNNAGTWEEVKKIVASDRAANDQFGLSVSISGEYSIVGAKYNDGNAGSAYIFYNNAGTWGEAQKIVPLDLAISDLFGSSVSISGGYAIVGAVGEDEDASGGNTLINPGSVYIFHDPAVLPVELTSFSANLLGSNVVLNWQTATELNNYGFEIERMTPSQTLPLAGGGQGGGWSKVGFVEGHGTTNAPKEYSFSDKTTTSGKYEYRLKQIDRDGKFIYSQSVEVMISSTPTVFALEQNYPNPFNPSTMISYQIPVNGKVSLKVFDVIGREVATLVNEVKEAGTYSVSFDGSKLSSGMYFAKLQTSPAGGQGGEKIQLKKMSLIK